MPQLVPLDEAAGRLKIDRTTLYRWVARAGQAVRKGQLKRYKGGIGDVRTYVDLADLERLRKPTPD